jgi:hypothetical protein
MGFVRAANEWILDLRPTLLADSDKLRLIGECRNPGCTGLLEMTAAEFDAVRAEAGLYGVFLGHERRGLGSIIGGCGRYVLVTVPSVATASRSRHSPAGRPSAAAPTAG